MTALTERLGLLKAHRDRLAQIPMRRLFEADPGRFGRLSATAAGITLDYSKTRIDAEAMAALIELAAAAGVAERRAAMFGGQPINATEGRAVLHVALRADDGDSFATGGASLVSDVLAERDRMLDFAAAIRSGAIAGGGGAFTDVVNIGIGGSDLGPAMVTRALRPYHDGPRLHFVSNVDGAQIADTLAGLDPGRTLFLVASKTFTTVETMTNAATARGWIAEALGDAAVSGHFAAMSTALDRVAVFGIGPDRVFGFWDWVGGRFSVWSSIGLPVAIAIGPVHFRAFLGGARAMDLHFRDAPLPSNLPVIMGVLGIWHRNVWDHAAHAVIPYDQRLERFPAYLQQLDMESNGKGRTVSGAPVPTATGAVVFGEPGTNGQHAFFQLLHQGTDVIPVDFLIAAEPHESLPDHHALLVANCLAQSEALMRGRTLEEARAGLQAAGSTPEEVSALAPHKVFSGSRPSSTLVYRRLDPATLGSLIALYEHKVFVEGIVWGINSFDQWGVELGKELATGLLPAVRSGHPDDGTDGSTAGLIRTIAALRGGPTS